MIARRITACTLAGTLAGAALCVALSVWIGRPIAGAACITLTLFPALFGLTVGACSE